MNVTCDCHMHLSQAYTLKSIAPFSSNTAFSLLPCKDTNKKEKVRTLRSSNK